MGEPNEIGFPVQRVTANGLTLIEMVVEERAAIRDKNMPRNATEKGFEGATAGYMHRGAIGGTLLGIVVFIGGVALLGLTFKLAVDMFGTDPVHLFGLEPGKTLDVGKAAGLLMAVIVRILLLLVMAIIGGLVANRGIHLYADSRHSKAVLIKERSTEGPVETRQERTGT